MNVQHLSRVLCAVDIDDADRQVFAHALALARSRNARLLILHAASPTMPFNRGATERVDFLRRLRATAEAAGVDVLVTVQRGDVAGVILLHARARQPDLIVLGTSADRSRRDRFGSIAERVLRGAPCPTLALPRSNMIDVPVFENIVCAVDLSPALPAVVTDALALAGRSARRVTLLHVVGVPGPAAAIALERLQGVIPQPQRAAIMASVAVGHPVDEVLRAVRAAGAQLLVIGARPRNRIGRRLFGTTGLLLRNATCPVLAVPGLVRAGEDSDRAGTLAA